MRSAGPTVTVLVPTYDRSTYLAECLDSLLRQTLPPSQVLVIDDGSTDATRDVLSRYTGRVEVCRSPQLGKGGALNIGLARATGAYTWVFDDDDVALPDALERVVAPLEADQGAGFSCAAFYYARSRDDGTIGEPYERSTIPDLARRGTLPPLLEANYLGGAALFARTQCYRDVGGFDESLIRSQDYGIALAMARRFRGGVVPDPPVLLYRQHGGDRGSQSDRFRAREQRRKWLEYDQRIFRRLLAELELGEYLPPQPAGPDTTRHALLQRMLVAASKLLVADVHDDLARLAALPDAGPLNADERRLATRLVMEVPYYGEGSLFDDATFFARVAALAPASPTIRRLRRTWFIALARRLRAGRRWLRPAALSTSLGHARRMLVA